MIRSQRKVPLQLLAPTCIHRTRKAIAGWGALVGMNWQYPRREVGIYFLETDVLYEVFIKMLRDSFYHV